MGASTCFVCRCFVFVRAVHPLISLQNRCYFLRLSDDHKADVERERDTLLAIFSAPSPLARVSHSTSSSCSPEKREEMY